MSFSLLDISASSQRQFDLKARDTSTPICSFVFPFLSLPLAHVILSFLLFFVIIGKRVSRLPQRKFHKQLTLPSNYEVELSLRETFWTWMRCTEKEEQFQQMDVVWLTRSYRVSIYMEVSTTISALNAIFQI